MQITKKHLLKSHNYQPIGGLEVTINRYSDKPTTITKDRVECLALDTGKEHAAELLGCPVNDVAIAKVPFGDETFFVFGTNTEQLLGLDTDMILNVNEDFAADSIPVTVGQLEGASYWTTIKFLENGPRDCRAERNWNEAQNHTRLAELERKVELLIAANEKLAANEKKLQAEYEERMKAQYEEQRCRQPLYREMTQREIAERDSWNDTKAYINDHYREAIDRENGVFIDTSGVDWIIHR